MKPLKFTDPAARMHHASAHLFPLATVLMLALCAASCNRKKSGDVRVLDYPSFQERYKDCEQGLGVETTAVSLL